MPRPNIASEVPTSSNPKVDVHVYFINGVAAMAYEMAKGEQRSISSLLGSLVEREYIRRARRPQLVRPVKRWRKRSPGRPPVRTFS